jgi:hypothetical protein
MFDEHKVYSSGVPLRYVHNVHNAQLDFLACFSFHQESLPWFVLSILLSALLEWRLNKQNHHAIKFLSDRVVFMIIRLEEDRFGA